MSTSPTEREQETITPIRQATIAKLSERAIGRMTYQIGVGESKTVYLAVTANDGGGYFSREWIALPRIRAVLADIWDADTPFTTSLLRAVYHNKSANNGGFLAAMLRHEGLLTAADPPHLHRITSDWEAWECEQWRCFEAGERLEAENLDAAQPPPKPLTRKRQRKETDHANE
ncbi:hypothetical protein ThidrDRAFT_4362 [Thiorhodococcus drewsii AZ1]|uniref:Uncharacterized protein n=1 Tax=Thiorhodococcus drewsii AZ1 TaxID=765913 RepID=G2E7U9_9GAMM|nr:hypothetical protein [Thiorhodococcus drewsii]EGV27824.1 hypothetical protein ThidrDRAFT_4362 [Thiorhodococcus drewsii AZ1]